MFVGEPRAALFSCPGIWLRNPVCHNPCLHLPSPGAFCLLPSACPAPNHAPPCRWLESGQHPPPDHDDSPSTHARENIAWLLCRVLSLPDGLAGPWSTDEYHWCAFPRESSHRDFSPPCPEFRLRLWDGSFSGMPPPQVTCRPP